MKLASSWNFSIKLIFGIRSKIRRWLPKKRVKAFGELGPLHQPTISRICLINLDRKLDRLASIQEELRYIFDTNGNHLWSMTERYSAVDARELLEDPTKDMELDPTYTLSDQLFVEPQPQTLPSNFDLSAPITMSRPEVAVARSHLNVWRQVAIGEHEHVLILEDDVWFKSNFATKMNLIWEEIQADTNLTSFDVLYLSYAEVKHGAPKQLLTRELFRPTRGLWYLSGYVLSKRGALKLLENLPCRGPIDLWINHKFSSLNVLAARNSIINQRGDTASTNSYSILPSLSKIGAINSEVSSLFHAKPITQPVFAFGPHGSGLTSLAMALSMLGYRCCSDLQTLPQLELEKLLSGSNDRIFNAYVNIGVLSNIVEKLKTIYPDAVFLSTEELQTSDNQSLNKWKLICEKLRCPPPLAVFPDLNDVGQRQITVGNSASLSVSNTRNQVHDTSPWITETCSWWRGIELVPTKRKCEGTRIFISFKSEAEFIESNNWFRRDDTFTGNLALFRTSNVEFDIRNGAVLTIRKEPLGVRAFSAGALTSASRYLYGRFEADFKASNVPGTVTGFFLHRDSPRQEIDIEITGNRPDQLLVNVFYNPGSEGARFDYGFRGAASVIDLGFDASKANHRFAIEWDPGEIRWFVDGKLIHRRTEWNPTPIPHLPMALHFNFWPTNSQELAGRLSHRRIPATASVSTLELLANVIE